METPQVPAPIGWIESFAQKINMDRLLQRFNLTTAVVLETALYFGGGVVMGFFAKRYLKQVIVGTIVLFFALKGLEYAGIIEPSVFNWLRIKELTGISPNETLSTVGKTWIVWMQRHIRQAVSAILGFWVGLKLA